jgi:hypothetical protein
MSFWKVSITGTHTLAGIQEKSLSNEVMHENKHPGKQYGEASVLGKESPSVLMLSATTHTPYELCYNSIIQQLE